MAEETDKQIDNELDVQHIDVNDIKPLTTPINFLPTKDILGMQDISQANDDMHRIVSELISDSNIEGKTDLNSNQIVAFARAAWFAKHYDSENMRTILNYLMKYLQSKNRQGRKELVNAIAGIFRYNLETQKNKQEKIEV